MSGSIGQEAVRVDGPEKVTGTARYTGEISPPGLAHARIVGARVPSGRVASIDTVAAERAGGVLAVLTHHDLPKVGHVPLVPSLMGGPAPGETFFPMQDDTVHYAGQPVAIVVAGTLEQAQHAAALVEVAYAEAPSVTTIEQGRADAYEPEKIFGGFLPARSRRGDVEAGLAEADLHVDAEFRFAANHHNALEALTTTAVWEGDRLTLYDSCQGIKAVQLTVAALLGMSPSKIRVLTRFVGGAFGSKAMVWPHVTLTALAARHVRRPVRLVVPREQMFTSCGHREEQEQHVRLGARRDGTLTAIRHRKISVTSPFDDWAEPAFGVSSRLYACPAFEGAHRLVRGNTMTPTFTRGPGEAAGVFSLECAMDELAARLGIDPVELRLRNLTDVDPETGHPWSSGGLADCLRRGAERFGWAGRDPAPGARREGNLLIGTGMAAAGYPVAFFMRTQRARARLYSDCTAVVSTAVQEFGTGMTTVLTQVAADGLGVDPHDVRLEFGDTDLPTAGSPVGSNGAMMVGAAVHDAAAAVRDQMIAMAAGDPESPLHGADPRRVTVTGGRMTLAGDPAAHETYGDLMSRHLMNDAEAIGSWDPPPLDTPYGLLTFGAQFAEVAVDADLGLVRVRRMTGVFAPGRVLNPRTARGQLVGGMLWGMSQALLEGTRMDPGLGRWANASLGDYLVPVNADAPDVDVELIEVEDRVTGPLGVKGVGEIGQVGSAAAVANAVRHATGHRVRELPIAPEHLLTHLPAPA
ncbi:xanthine dehydrogenase family protein molybdopterin-binding subunit [Actinomadura madurae]|uniref:xanthine dehydrogenase family protein molybdopterin-binding subunit n=1 Tax=Actinomadura madurae TaxID=1993 RepID=UPI002025CBA6|nr:xanthine dehydrogenase family protein molybdopterin-binding subunit [Actinomadura madurae]MCP9953413.1 xanthine dehydrogenase family protein molybdopterin-binding subunit [Actinomadura madurae]URM98874.1 xanthine dehydrogenase family protein molybdopterin-binding subunit [Actinomadura madurae]URN09566.1 xanthine dehydrogenase family protein molybdopterin-binding subunit [Actinomadura madurae]